MRILCLGDSPSNDLVEVERPPVNCTMAPVVPCTGTPPLGDEDTGGTLAMVTELPCRGQHELWVWVGTFIGVLRGVGLC